MQRQSERANQEELQQRREMLVNYLQTVLQPDDERLQSVISSLRSDLQQHRVAHFKSSVAETIRA